MKIIVKSILANKIDFSFESQRFKDFLIETILHHELYIIAYAPSPFS